MTTSNPKPEDARSVWQECVEEALRVDPPIPVADWADTLWSDRASEAEERCGFHLAVLDASLGTLIALDRLLEGIFPPDGDSTVPSFLFFAGRILHLTTSIRRLLSVGLEQAAAVVLRSILETADLAVAALADEEFGRVTAFEYDEAFESEKEFWEEEVAYGKINDRLKLAGEKWGIPTIVEKHLEWKRAVKGKLSPYVHSTGPSVLQSRFLRVGADRFRVSATGGTTSQTSNLIAALAVEIDFVAYSTWKAIEDGRFSDQMEFPRLKSLLYHFIAHAQWVHQLQQSFPEQLLGELPRKNDSNAG